MKEAYLIFNETTESYILYNSKDKNPNSRIDLGIYDASGLVNEIRGRYDPKRNTLIHVVGLEAKVIIRLRDIFNGSKVVIQEDKRD